MTNQQLIKFLYQFQDKKYLQFNRKIVNSNKNMIGIRIPIMRKIAKDLSKDYKNILNILTTTYYEEILLEGLIISHIKDNNDFEKYFNKFILKIDNWAICDTCISSMKQLKQQQYFRLSIEYIKANQEFKTRIGYIIILDHFLNDNYIDQILNIIDDNPSGYYYVNMARAWLLSICFIKYRDKTLKYLPNSKLDSFTYNKTISKIIDSYRVSKDDKEYMKSLKRNT